MKMNSAVFPHSFRSLWLTGLLCVSSGIGSGCSFTVPLGPQPPDQVNNENTERVAAGEIWGALARAVDSETISTTTRLAQYVTVLARNGELRPDDIAAFDRAFPGVTTTERGLTKQDSELLRTLK